MNLAMKKGGVFIIGMRRSGTSILRRLVEEGTKGKILFEPHDFWFAIRRSNLARIRETSAWKAAATDIKRHFDGPGVRGAKLAFDPWMEGLEWPKVENLFPAPRYVFIRRTQAETFASYEKLDSKTTRGCVRWAVHCGFWMKFYRKIELFVESCPKRAILVEYEDLVTMPHGTLEDIFGFLGCKAKIDTLAAQVTRPENWTEPE